MKRFQKLVVDAKDGLLPWEPLPEERIPAIARQLEVADIADIVAASDQLAQEKLQTPGWDGDTRDDIARAQELFARLLISVPAPLRGQVDTTVQSASRDTREWVAVVRGSSGS